MITKWAASSWMVILISLGLILQLYHLTLICWIVLEMFTWSLFFLFFISYSKVLNNHLFLFFIIQTSCSFIWLLTTIMMKMEMSSNLFACLTVALSLIVKMGLFPGHMWSLHIYNSASMPVILALSSFIKFTPLIMLVLWFTEHVNESTGVVLFYWIILSYIIVMVNMWTSRNLFSFMFFSGMFHISNMILILMMNLLPFFFLYYLTYILILLSFITMYYHYNINNLQSDFSFMSDNFLILHLLSVAGFPPFPLFWYKLLILHKVWSDDFFVSNSSFVIVVVMFVYLLTLFMFVIKGWGSLKNYNTKWLSSCVASVEKMDSKALLPHFALLFLPLTTMFALH